MAVSERLQRFLKEHDVLCDVQVHPVAYTAQETAAALHVSGRKVAKVVVARGGSGRYLMAVLPAPSLVDTEAMAGVAGETRVSLANEGEVARLFPDCETGAMPPFGNLYGVPVYVDDSLARAEEIVFPAGSHRETVRMRYRDYESLVHPAVGHLSL